LEYSESTRHALVDSAVDLFTKRGYAATSLDEVAKRARVTKGALYHHFSGKQALFEAAFDAVESRVMTRLAEIVVGPGDPWERAMNGIQQYIKICLDPAYQRIVVHEAPVVMGWERWREAEDHFSEQLIRLVVRRIDGMDHESVIRRHDILDQHCHGKRAMRHTHSLPAQYRPLVPFGSPNALDRAPGFVPVR